MNIVTRGVGALALVSALSLALAAAVARTGAPLAPTAMAGDIVIRKVSVVDTATGHISTDRDVVVRGGKIVGVVPAAPAYPSSVRAIDGAGKFVVPGYNDMHAHSLDPNPRDRLDNLTLMLANGITGFRQMSGTPKLLEERRESKLLPFADAPAVLSMPGQILMPLNAPTPAAAIAEVDRQKADGADFIKVVDVDAATFFAVGTEAKKLGLTFGGHLPDRVDALQASAAGFHFIEHMGPWSTILVSCSTDEQAIREVTAERPTRTFGGSGNGESLPPEMLNRIISTAATAPLVNSMKANPNFAAMLRRIMGTFDQAKCRRAMAVFKRNGTWMSPTLVRVRTSMFPDDPAFVNDPNLRYVTPQTRALWKGLSEQFTAAVKPEDRATLEAFWKLQLRMLNLFDASGLPMMAGSDTPGQWDIAGFSLHADFDLLAASGLKPLRILQMTTIEPARFLGRTVTMGSVAAGKNADLVLLDANPVESAANLHKIAGVLRQGHFYSRTDLDRMLAEVAARAAGAAD